jgi:DNA-binding LacI/PurR family transcriptional regulator
MVGMRDVAREAGVHQSTVSRVLNGSDLVNMRTARRVRAIAERLEFVPNTIGRALRTRVARTLAVHAALVPGQAADPFFTFFLKGLGTAAADHGYAILLHYTEGQRGGGDTDLASPVRSGHADGVVVLSPRLNDPRIRRLVEEQIPCVLGRFDGPMGSRAACMDIDNEATGRRAAQFCLARGHRRIGLIAEPADWETGIHVTTGFRAVLRGAGCDSARLIRRGPLTFNAARAAALGLLGQRPAPTAIVTTTPLLVFGALEAVRQSGRPVMVLGVDSPLLTCLHPAAPRIVAPVEELGRAMASALIALLRSGTPPPPTMLQTHIIDERGKIFKEGATL